MDKETADRIALCGYSLNYNGNLTGRIEGQVLGPSTVGEWFTILATEYVSEDDVTVAHCGYATVSEVGMR